MSALYVHFPFCLSICPYCDFVVYAGRVARGPVNQVDRFVDALVAEIGLRAQDAVLRARHDAKPGLASVYLGGGTPSLMSARQVSRVLRAADVAFGIAADAEITLEVNPGTGERGDMAGFRAVGVNRLSTGAQSFDGAELRRLGRRHAADDVAAAVADARRAGFDNLSLDLLYDIPGQTPESWRATIDAALALAPDHLSAYALDLATAVSGGAPNAETGDHLAVSAGAARWRERGRREQDEERAALMYETADAALSAAGLPWYELSNWARPGRESRHNRAYWLGDPWLAVGPGAHAFDGARTRSWNAARLDGYLDALAPADGSGAQLPPRASETTDEPTAAAEAAILRLRTRDGLPGHLASRLEFGAALAWAVANGLTEVDGDGSVRLTVRGRLLSNELFARLLPTIDKQAAA